MSKPNLQPSKRDVEKLLRELIARNYDNPLYLDYHQAQNKEEELERTLLDCSEMRKATRKRETAYRKWNECMDKTKAKVRHLRQRFLASGVSPVLLRDLNKLVKEVNPC